MSGLIPQSQRTSGNQFQESQALVSPFNRTIFDLIQRQLLGQSIALPDTPISVPLQQSISGVQDALVPIFEQAFGANRGIRGLLDTQAQTPFSGDGEAAAPPQFGRTQTREELGLPSRRENFPFTPTVQDFEETGLVPLLRNSPLASRRTKANKRLIKRTERLEEKKARREAKGKSTAKVERRIDKTKRKQRRINL